MTELSSIKDQVAVVSGGAAGIGLACAERFAAEGAKVAIIDRDRETGEAAVRKIETDGGEAMFTAGDCTSEADMDAAVAAIVDRWGRLDILVNCAGGFHAAPPIEELDAETWRAGIDWNLSGIYLPMRAVVPAMKTNNYGRIVSIGSQAGRMGTAITAIDYSAAKAAVVGLSRRLAVELAPFGITVNTVAPGTVLTPRIAVLHAERMDQLASAMPVGRLGKPEEIAHAVWYLCTPGAAFTTGATLDVNGGSWTG
ncbi:MAG: SDR family NAD(P)-dependent oxidoreductase [Alphaproteobacteria bacterium]|nr:SDR family NAD(P)-dependent oxidoreductase [Alphaproteobacteria bacterium]MCZ6846456.1 SDR family NAD(P)-dependent oxidoreductase [Alphaproteobacteria bacterium]